MYLSSFVITVIPSNCFHFRYNASCIGANFLPCYFFSIFMPNYAMHFCFVFKSLQLLSQASFFIYIYYKCHCLTYNILYNLLYKLHSFSSRISAFISFFPSISLGMYFFADVNNASFMVIHFEIPSTKLLYSPLTTLVNGGKITRSGHVS